MGLKNNFTAFLLSFFLLCEILPFTSSAQWGSFYLSAGYNKSWYGKSSIRIEQGEIGNSYSMTGVKGNNKTNTAISATQLNYRLGYFFDDRQTIALEVSFDPFNYAIADNQLVKIKGTYNNTIGVNSTLLMSSATGSYYHFSGANLFMMSFVKRYQIFKNNAKSVRVDILGKAGVGPALPHFTSSIPVNPVDNPQFKWSGWTLGGEMAIRTTLYRYGFVEIAGKYNYAAFSGLKIYNGTADQNLNIYSVVGSIGVALPTTKYNTLFYKERKIVTMLPFYQHKDEIGRKIRKKKIKTGSGEDSLVTNGIGEVPEFMDIVEKQYRKDHPFNILSEDSINNNVFITLDSAGNFVSGDSTLIVVDTNAGKPAPEHLSKRELRKKKKAEKKEKEKKALEGPKTETPVDSNAMAPLVNPDEPKAPETKEPEIKAPDQPQPEVKQPDAPAEKKEPEVKPEEPKAPEMSKKEKRRKEKEEKREAKRKAKDEKPAPEQPENKDKPETPPAEKTETPPEKTETPEKK